MAIISDGFFREGMGGAPVSASYLTTAADGTLTAEVVLTATQTELNYVSGVTSALQTQLGNKAASSHTHAQGDVTNLTTDLGNKQAADAGLTSLAALPTAADKIAYSTAADTWAEATITAAGLALIDDANAAAQLATLGAQPSSSALTQIAAMGDPGADRIAMWDESSNNWVWLTAGTGLTITDTTMTAGGAFALIGSATGSGASAALTVGSIPGTCSALKVILVGRSDAAGANNVTVLATFNADAGANYTREYVGAANGVSDLGQQLAQNGMGFNVPGATSAAGLATQFEMTIPLYAGTTFHKYGLALISGANSAVMQAHLNAYRWSNTAAITSITFTAGAGNWIAGSTLLVYGIT